MKTHDVKKGAVLVIDDQSENLKVLISVLQDCGLTILVAQQGEHALDLAEQFTPDVILLDVRMPDKTGFETCLQLKANNATQDIPVIFMMASPEMVDTTKGFEVGGIDYLLKPFLPQEIIARVNAYLTIRKLQQQLHKQPRSTLSDKESVVQVANQMSAQHDQEELSFREAVEIFEKKIIAIALAQHHDNTAKTAASLDIPLRTLYRKIKKYRLL